MPILASRGCPYQCTFCSSPLMWTTRWSARKPEAVLAEMKDYMRRYRVTNFDFYDLTAIVKRSWIVDFCRLLIAEGLDITWQLPTGTRSEAIDEEVARLLHASGCRIISYAPESGSRAELARIKKKVDPDRMIASMRGARRAGLTIKTNFVFGFPGSTWRDVRHSFAFLARLAVIGVDDVNVVSVLALPGHRALRPAPGRPASCASTATTSARCSPTTIRSTASRTPSSSARAGSPGSTSRRWRSSTA